ncbi:pilus assembly protein [Pseudomonas indica]|uniref:pilus assembly protein n=1 Tax=Pseudomonas indica TaxID=137658 RepID=UPI0023F8ADF3|nr:PilC/PilY family type IV pilus protein [Pseudomonas indica]MBU3059511.1 pilus assembly protein PilY [Pseudomonas indica]
MERPAFGKTLLGLLAGLCIFGSAQSQAANLSLSQLPLFLTEGVAPNIMVTIDNSGSMRWAFAPDGLNPGTGSTYNGYSADQIRTSRRAKSSTFNPLYYNPKVTYQAPYQVTYSGGTISSTPMTTSFTAAYVNGFKTSKGTYDLSSNYMVTWEYDTERSTSTSGMGSYSKYTSYASPDKVYWLAANPSADFASSTTTTSTGTPTSTTSTFSGSANRNEGGSNVASSFSLTISNVSVSITSASNSSTCTASIDSSSSSGTPTSTTSNGTTTSTTVVTTISYSNVTCSKSGSGNTKTYTVSATKTTTQTTTTTVTTADRTTTGVPAYYYVFDSSLANCDGTVNDDDCYSLVTVSSTSGTGGTDERQNFANWYSFYRNRELATQSAANLAFSSLSDSTRLSWQALGTDATCITSTSYLSSYNCRGLSNSSTSYYDNRLRNFSGAHRAKFFEWLGDIYYNQGTPLLAAVDRVGNFLTATGVNGPYAYSLGSTESPVYACRASYSITLTDGIWNTAGSHGEYDNASRTLPDGQGYSPKTPYKDSTSNTMADLAFKYWATDAQPNVANEVPTYTKETSTNASTQYWNPKNNPATWQHMTSFFVGLGLTNSLTSPAWGGSTYSGDYDNLVSGNIVWPAASAGSQNNVYDLWHAALNSRGEFFSVDSPGDLVTALQEVINRISERTGAAASPAVTSPLLDSDGSNSYDTYTYTPSFSSEDWSGDLKKYQQDTATGTKEEIWSAQDILDNAYGSGNSAYGSRTIKIADSDGNLQSFTWSNLTSAQRTALNRTIDGVADSNGESRVAFLRGDRSNEGSLFRTREHILGDIIDSTPVIVRKPSRLASRMNKSEGQSASEASSYTAFKSAYAERETRIYVGANDGMLHAFDEDGHETFAFIPSAVIGNLYKLADENYASSAHQYYVDGSPTEADVFFDGAWHSVVIGSLRGGGRSLFALDVTDPDNITLLWEISANDSDYSQLGFTYSKPAVTRLSNGKWAVVAGNGYNSDDDQAVLYLIDVEDGSLIKAITVDDDSSAANGMASPYVADLDGDLIADYIYAGDLRGNLWRFDVLGSTTSSYDVSFSGEPLYSARASNGTVQPITSRPYLVKHPNGTGYIVVFGTGKYLENDDSDPNTSVAMSLYGIWDTAATVDDTTSSTPSLSRDDLLEQAFELQTTASFDNNGTAVTSTIRTVSDNEIDWLNDDGSVHHYGWFLDLKVGSSLEGEMVVTNPYITDGVLIASTLIPNEDPCEDGVTTWLLTLDPTTGGALASVALDLNNDGVVDSLDSYNGASVAGVQMDGLTGGFTVSRDADGNVVVCGSDGCETLSGSASTSGRQSWRPIESKE